MTLGPFRPSGEGPEFCTGAGRGKGVLMQEIERGTLISGMDTGGRIGILREGGPDGLSLGMEGSLRVASW